MKEREFKYIDCLNDYGFTEKECEEIKMVHYKNKYNKQEMIIALHPNHKAIIIEDGKTREV